METDVRRTESPTRRGSFDINGAGSDSLPSSQKDLKRAQ
jgi:hypothetical protein